MTDSITVFDPTEKLNEMDFSFFSDLYKSDTGVRPSLELFNSMFDNVGDMQAWLDQREAEWDEKHNPTPAPRSWSESHTNNPFAILKG